MNWLNPSFKSKKLSAPSRSCCSGVYTSAPGTTVVPFQARSMLNPVSWVRVKIMVARYRNCAGSPLTGVFGFDSDPYRGCLKLGYLIPSARLSQKIIPSWASHEGFVGPHVLGARRPLHFTSVHAGPTKPILLAAGTGLGRDESFPKNGGSGSKSLGEPPNKES